MDAITVNEILAFWVDEDKPSQNDTRLNSLLKLAKAQLKKAIPLLENRLNEEDVKLTVEFTLSSAIQRAWYDDYSGKDSVNWSQGPFSTGFSKNGSKKTGIYFTDQELSSLKTDDENSPFIILRREAKPNFPINDCDGWWI